MRRLTKHGLAAGAAAVGLIIGAPAVWAGSQSPLQPPAGTIDRSPAPAAPVPAQPVNRHPEKAGPQVGLRHSTVDLGTKNLPVQRDLGAKNLPVQRDLGDD